MQKLKERRAQIARYAFFTVPIVAGSVGFMGAVELGKLLLGSRKDERAWLFGAIAPAGAIGVWRRNPYMGLRWGVGIGLLGYAYQFSTNMNYSNMLFYPMNDNPNIMYEKDPFNRDVSGWNLESLGTENEYSKINERLGIHAVKPEPSWKKWEDKE